MCIRDSVIRSLDSKKAIGIDTISAKILKDVDDILAKPVFTIFNMMVDEDLFLSQAKIASILPLYKDQQAIFYGGYDRIVTAVVTATKFSSYDIS